MRITLIGKIGTVDWRRGSKDVAYSAAAAAVCRNEFGTKLSGDKHDPAALRVHVPQYSPIVLQPYFVCTV